jgi:hypothetical protein
MRSALRSDRPKQVSEEHWASAVAPAKVFSSTRLESPSHYCATTNRRAPTGRVRKPVSIRTRVKRIALSGEPISDGPFSGLAPNLTGYRRHGSSGAHPNQGAAVPTFLESAGWVTRTKIRLRGDRCSAIIWEPCSALLTGTSSMRPDIRIPATPFFSTGQLSRILGLSHSTTCAWIDRGIIQGYRLPTRRRDRRVTRAAVIAFARRHPGFQYILRRISGIDAIDDFAEANEPPPPPALPVRSAPPRSPERPRSVRFGRVPSRSHYPLREVAYACGVCRRTVWKWVRARELLAIRAPSTGPCSWRWLVSCPVLLAFIDRHHFRFAMSRIEGCEPAVPATDHKVGPRDEALVPPVDQVGARAQSRPGAPN